MKKTLFFVTSFLAVFPTVVFAQERTIFHIIYERTFGVIGAVAGIIAMVAFWQVSKIAKDENTKFILKMFVLVLFFINIGSASFGIHGAGILDGETSRYIERICRLIALLIADVAALKIFLQYNKKNKSDTIDREGAIGSVTDDKN